MMSISFEEVTRDIIAPKVSLNTFCVFLLKDDVHVL